MIERAEHKDNFVQVSNDTVRDDRLSLEARGFLVFLLSLTDEWDFSVSGLSYQLNLSPQIVARLIKELKACGYIRMTKHKNSKGRFDGYEWTITELSKNRGSEKPKLGKTETRENRNTERPKYEITETRKNVGLKNTNNIENQYKENQRKEAHGEFSNVLLTPEQFNKLGEQFGTLQRDLVLEELSGYITEHPKKYKDHYITLRNWLLKRKGEQKAQPAPAQTVGVDWAKYYAIADRVERGNR